MIRALFVLAGLAGSAHAQVLRAGQPAVELDIAVDAKDKSFKLASFRGRWVVLAIGAAWCDPCKAELPVLDRFAGEFSAVFITLAIDDEIPDGKAFHDRLKLSRLVRAYMPEERSAIAGRYGANKMPSTFVIDPAGVVRLVHDGFDHKTLASSTKKLHAALASVLPRPKPPAPKPPQTKPPAPAPPIVPAPPVTPKPPTMPLVSAVPAIVWPDAPRARWWSDAWTTPTL